MEKGIIDTHNEAGEPGNDMFDAVNNQPRTRRVLSNGNIVNLSNSEYATEEAALRENSRDAMGSQ